MEIRVQLPFGFNYNSFPSSSSSSDSSPSSSSDSSPSSSSPPSSSSSSSSSQISTEYEKINPNEVTGGNDDNQEFCCIIKSILQRTYDDSIDMDSVRIDFNNNGWNIDENNYNKENYTTQQNFIDYSSKVIQRNSYETLTKMKLMKKCKNPKDNLNYCVFCMNNKESEELYMSHSVRNKAGITICPILRRYSCPICNATGDNAHTVRYCPKKSIVTSDEIPNNKSHLKNHRDHKMQPPSYRLGLRM